jgi:hypothetical protein
MQMNTYLLFDGQCDEERLNLALHAPSDREVVLAVST